MMMRRATAFTLVELLVVITIIAVLIAMLMPALDQAVYQAQLAVDAAKIKGILGKVNLYAMDHKRSYPFRKGVILGDEPAYPHERTPMDFNRYYAQADLAQDDRPVYKGYFGLNKDFNDPFVEPVDIEKAVRESWTQGTYAMWFGYGYNVGGQQLQGMFRMGDRFEYGGRYFNWLVTDHDYVGKNPPFFAQASHPDRDGIMGTYALQNSAGGTKEESAALVAAGIKFTYSRWEAFIPGSLAANFAGGVAGQPTPNAGLRGELDLSYGASDGSVLRINHIPAARPPTGDDPVVHVPGNANGDVNGGGLQLPR